MSGSKQTAIKVEHVYKNFKLPHEKINSIKRLLTQGLSRKRGYEVQHALRDINLDIKHGEFFGIVGRNGSGKSTLLKILAEIYQPNKGSVTVNGRLVPFIELGVGFNPELTGRENVYLNGALLGFNRKQIDAMYNEIVEFAELEDFMDQKLKNYSSGMQVRLAFSVATRAEADILLVDEVLAVGDADFQRKCFNHFKKLKKEKKTVVFVSHDMSAVREYCDRAVLIEKSQIVKEGKVSEVAAAYSKMFMTDDEIGESSSEEKVAKKRWGDNKIIQTGVKVLPSRAKETNKNLILQIDYEARETVEEPVFGFLIKNAGGTGIMGTNTKIQRKNTGIIQAGQKGSLVWTIPNVLNDGDYTIDLAISHTDTISQYDWWEDSLELTVYREDRTPYVVVPPVEVEIT